MYFNIALLFYKVKAKRNKKESKKKNETQTN